LSPKLRTFLLTLAIVLPADQLTKAWIVEHVPQSDPIEVVEGFFQITHSRNPGAALGLFQGTPVGVFVLLTALAIGLVASFYRRIEPQDRLSLVALGLILSGAVGNLLDRLFRGEVVDFLQFDLRLFIFPDFNVADSSIVVGIALLLRDLVLPHPRGMTAGTGSPGAQ
jgi:signal peptidase II